MLIKAISDIHGNISLITPDGADVVAIAGDIAPISSLSSWGKKDQYYWMRDIFCPRIENFPTCKFVFVSGNHDFWDYGENEGTMAFPNNAYYLKDKSCEIDGIRFYGTPYVPWFCGQWAFETLSEEIKNKFSKIPNGIDILITHTPPVINGKYVDCVCQHSQLYRHLGSEELSKEIVDKKPRISIFGHIHSGVHEATQLGETTCYNVSVLDEEYRNTYNPRIIEFNH